MADDTLDAWGYVRLSQEGRDGSLDEQKAALREYAANNDRLRLVTTLNEGHSTSGFNNDREKYGLLVEKVKRGEIGAVVVRDRARLSRDFDERLRLLTYFRAGEVELHVVEDGGKVDLSDVQIAAMECIHASMDHFKKKIEIERAREVVRERVEKGYWQGRPPFGLQFDDRKQHLEPGDDFETALAVLDERDSGTSWRGIADELGVSLGTARRVYERRELYEEHRETPSGG